MKKNLVALVLSSLAIVSSRADVVFTEGFNYPDGPILTNAPTIWFRHSGTANPSDSIVHSKKLEVSATGGATVSRQDDVHCNFSTFTNTQTILYSSFTVRCTNLPPATGTYFAHFYVNSSTFHARLYAQAPAGVLPGCWRLGIAGAAGTVNKLFNVDLTTNVDYQVVVQWDPVTLFAATLWVNPIGQADLAAGPTLDGVASPPASLGYAFRQGSSFGNFFCNISNLVIATTWDEAATNVWATNAVPPIVAIPPASTTNFIGDTVDLSAVAAGQGIADLTYTWLKDGNGVANNNGNSNVLSFTASSSSQSGNYRLVATTPYGLSVTSAVAFLWVTNATVPPTISPTTNSTVTVFYHQSGTLSVSASGPPTITYQWYYTNAPVSNPNVSDPTQPTITISDVFTNNGTAGAYYCVASNPYGSKTSGVFTVVASGPPAVSIAYLRTLVDPVNFVATNSSLRWQATGTVTTFTNLTSGDTSSYYLQDGTAGINIFTTRGHDFRPPQGASVTFIGFLSSFNSTLELEADTNDISTGFMINTNNDGTTISNALPAPFVIPFNVTNNLAQSEYSLEGKTVMLTNVYFGTNAGNAISTTANTTITVTNAGGETFTLLFSSQDLDVAGQVLPAFAYSVVGIFNQNLGNAVVPRNQGYDVEVTRFSDIVTNPPPPVTATIARSGIGSTVSWPNVPWDNVNYSYGSNYSYTVLAPPASYVANLSGPTENPPNSSTGTGFGRVVVSPDGSTITVNMSFSGLTAPATAAHIHGPAGVGTNASVLFPFSGVPNATSGSIPEQSFALTPVQAGYLANGLLYMNVHNANFPGGEIRDQLRLPGSSFTDKYVVQSNFQANLLGVNEVPATPGTGTGFGSVYLSPDQTTITVDFSFSGLSAPASAAHIHGPAGAGTNASVLFPFSGVPNATSGSIPRQSFAITPTQVGYLQAGLLYMNVHNPTYPGGELRDQIRLVPATGLTSANTSLTNTSPTTATYSEKDARGHKFYRVGSP
jgi:hypothetical protein